MSSVQENDQPDYDHARKKHPVFAARTNYIPLLPRLLTHTICLRRWQLRRRRWWGWLILAACGCQPAATVFEVASSSMAPTLLGPSRLANCPHCQNSFPVAADTYRASLPTRCSQCGGTCQVGDEIIPGQRVAIAPARAQQTWHHLDLIVFRDSTSGAPQVKRVWGLPHESITLQNGEIYIANKLGSTPRLFQKTLQQLMQICVLVSNYPDHKISGWRISRQDHPADDPVEDQNLFSRTGTPLALHADEALDWTFHRPAPVYTAEVAAEQWLQQGPIIDDYHVNQGISCTLHEVGDYLLSIDLQSALSGEMTVHCRQGGSVIPIKFHSPDSKTNPPTLTESLSRHAGVANELVFLASRQIKIAWCDQRLLLETDLESRAIARSNLLLNDGPWPRDDKLTQSLTAAAPILRIEANCELRLKQITIARDLYFDDWRGENTGTEGYFVLGDNLPVSIDSRNKLGRIAPQQIIGSVESK